MGVEMIGGGELNLPLSLTLSREGEGINFSPSMGILHSIPSPSMGILHSIPSPSMGIAQFSPPPLMGEGRVGVRKKLVGGEKKFVGPIPETRKPR